MLTLTLPLTRPLTLPLTRHLTLPLTRPLPLPLPLPIPIPMTLPLTRPLPLPLTRYAAYLGMDPVADVHLLWIARDALHASVPAPWVEGLDMRERLP